MSVSRWLRRGDLGARPMTGVHAELPITRQRLDDEVGDGACAASFQQCPSGGLPRSPVLANFRKLEDVIRRILSRAQDVAALVAYLQRQFFGPLTHLRHGATRRHYVLILQISNRLPGQECFGLIEIMRDVEFERPEWGAAVLHCWHQNRRSRSCVMPPYLPGSCCLSDRDRAETTDDRQAGARYPRSC